MLKIIHALTLIKKLMIKDPNSNVGYYVRILK